VAIAVLLWTGTDWMLVEPVLDGRFCLFWRIHDITCVVGVIAFNLGDPRVELER
jgi:hypothetical protein